MPSQEEMLLDLAKQVAVLLDNSRDAQDDRTEILGKLDRLNGRTRDTEIAQAILKARVENDTWLIRAAMLMSLSVAGGMIGLFISGHMAF